MENTNIENLWNLFLENIDNKQAFNDMRKNNQMPILERRDLFKKYLFYWCYAKGYDLSASHQLFDYSYTI